MENTANSIIKTHLNLCRAPQILSDSIFKQIKYYDSLCEEYDEENTPLESNSMLILEVINRLLYLTNKKTHSTWGEEAKKLPVNLDIFSSSGHLDMMLTSALPKILCNVATGFGEYKR